MKINKISGLILFILSVFTVVLFCSQLLIGSLVATNVFTLALGIFLITGFVWFISLFFIKKEEGNKFKIFLKMFKNLFLMFLILILIYLFIGEPVTVGNTSVLVGITPNKTYFINKISGVKRGSIVDYNILRDGIDYGDQKLGRVVGLPNEKIFIKQGTVEINDTLYSEKDIDWSKWGKDDVFNYDLKDSEYLVTFDLTRTLESVHVVSKQSIKGVIK